MLELLGTRPGRAAQRGHSGLVVGELREHRGLGQIQLARSEGIERERVLRDRDGGLDSCGRQVPAPRDLSGAEAQTEQLLGSAGLIGLAQAAAVLVFGELIQDSVDGPGALVGERLVLDQDPDPVQTVWVPNWSSTAVTCGGAGW